MTGVPEPDARPLGVGLIGYGVSGSTFHAPLIAAEPRLRLVAIATTPTDRARQDYPGAFVTEDPLAVVQHPDVELVIVATPNATHARIASAALEGHRHVVVDKPFTVSTDDADALIDLARKQNRVLSVFHNRRWDGDFQTLQRCIKGGLLGEVRRYTARFDRWMPAIRVGWREEPATGAGVLWDLGAHLIDQALVLFGQPIDVWASVGTDREGALVPDRFHIVMRYPRLEATLEASSLVRSRGPRYEVHGDAGSFIKYGLDTQEAMLKAGRGPGTPGWGIDPDDAQVTYSAEGVELIASARTLPGAYERYYRALVTAIVEGAPPPVVAGDGRDVVHAIELAVTSERTGKRQPW